MVWLMTVGNIYNYLSLKYLFEEQSYLTYILSIVIKIYLFERQSYNGCKLRNIPR